MSKGKGKKQFQGAGRRFRGDVWLDEKVSGRTMHALQERGVKFPPGTNVRYLAVGIHKQDARSGAHAEGMSRSEIGEL